MDIRLELGVVSSRQLKNKGLATAIEGGKCWHMNAKSDDLSRLQELHDIISQTKRQMVTLGFSKERCANPRTDEDDLMAGSCVL